MCIVCKEWNSGKLTKKEAMNALSELINFEDDREKIIHYYDTLERIEENDEE
jgi:hypothetical protein